MANKTDIQTFEYTVPTKDGAQSIYSVKVVDQNGVVKDSISTSDYAEASKFYETAKAKNPSTTVGGSTEKQDESLKKSDASFDNTVGPAPPPADNIEDSSNPGMEEMKGVDAGRPPMSSFNDRNEKFTSNTKKKAVDCDGLPDAQRRLCELPNWEKYSRGISGVFGQKRIQAKINRIDCESELVHRGPDNNAFIVIGNDRSSNELSGYGGKGYTQCDSVDIVAGMGGFKPNQADQSGSPFYTSPNFFLDAARIHISQKTDVDENFNIGLKEGMQTKSKAKSAITVKADNVRLVGRESLVLVTNTDTFNSQGGQIQQWSGIHLMANNDEKGLQPIPVGNNLSKCLHELSKHLESLGKLFHGYLKYQMKYNQVVANHTHIEKFFAKKTLPSLECQFGGQLVNFEQISKTELSILKHLTNLAGFRSNFLTMKGKDYINSRFNKTN